MATKKKKEEIDVRGAVIVKRKGIYTHYDCNAIKQLIGKRFKDDDWFMDGLSKIRTNLQVIDDGGMHFFEGPNKLNELLKYLKQKGVTKND